MKCKEVNLILDGHGLASLTAAERNNLDAHLASCSACAESYGVWELLGREILPGPRAGLFERLSRQMPDSAAARARAPRNRYWPVLGGVAAVAALLLLAVAAFVVPRGGGPDTPAGPAAAEVAGSASPGAGFLAQPSRPANSAAPFVEGREYAALPGPAQIQSLGNKVSVWLFYMWSCLHCYDFEPELTAWLGAQDSDEIELVRVPVQWNAPAALHARAFYAAELLGVADSVSAEVYASLHERGESLETRSQIATVFARAGVDRETFLSAYESPEVDAVLTSARAVAEAFGIDSTPTMVVAGAYRTNPSMAGSTERMFDTVDWLIEQIPESADGSSGHAFGQRLSAVDQHGLRVREFQTRDRSTAAPAPIREASCAFEPDAALAEQIRYAEVALDRLLLRYTERHPEVVAEKTRLEQLEAVRDRQRGAVLADCVEDLQAD